VPIAHPPPVPPPPSARHRYRRRQPLACPPTVGSARSPAHPPPPPTRSSEEPPPPARSSEEQPPLALIHAPSPCGPPLSAHWHRPLACPPRAQRSRRRLRSSTPRTRRSEEEPASCFIQEPLTASTGAHSGEETTSRFVPRWLLFCSWAAAPPAPRRCSSPVPRRQQQLQLHLQLKSTVIARVGDCLGLKPCRFVVSQLSRPHLGIEVNHEDTVDTGIGEEIFLVWK
jgi:hypothetical protein